MRALVWLANGAVGALLAMGCVESIAPEPLDGGSSVGCGDRVVVLARLRCEVLGGALSSPRDAWLTRAGDLMVSEFGAGRIVRLEGSRWVTIAEGLNGPIGLREASDGRLIVGEEFAGSVSWIDPATGARAPIAEDLRAVTYLALDSGGTLFVSRFDDVGGEVLRIDPASGAVTPFATGLHVPEGLFVDERGALHVAEWQLPSAILRFDREGPATGAAVLATGFEHVYGLLPDGAGGFLVGDHAGRVVHVDLTGGSEVLIDGIGRPGGLARDADRRVIVVEFVDFGQPGRILRLSAR